MLLPRFPSSLPPLTILDCILDVDWRTNGILHVLDVLKWKGQDVADCETPFRFESLALVGSIRLAIFLKKGFGGEIPV